MPKKTKTSEKYCTHCGFKVRKRGADNKEKHDKGAHHQQGSNGSYAPPSKTRRK